MVWLYPFKFFKPKQANPWNMGFAFFDSFFEDLVENTFIALRIINDLAWNHMCTMPQVYPH